MRGDGGRESEGGGKRSQGSGVTLADLPQVSDGVSAHDSDERRLHSGSHPRVYTYGLTHRMRKRQEIRGKKDAVTEGSGTIGFIGSWKPLHKTPQL